MPKTQGIRHRADGQWELRMRLDGVRRSYYAHTYQGAVDLRAEKLNERKHGITVKADQRSLGQFLTDWLEQSVRPSVRPLTYEQYAQHVRLYLAPKRNDGTHRPLPALGTIRVPKLTPAQVQGFINRQLKKKLSPRTVQLSLVILRRALDQAVRWNMAARNVAKLVDPPRAKRPPFKVLTPEQTQQFLRAAVDHPLESLFVVALATGLREGELFGLKWSDINFDDKTLTVNRTVHRVSERYSGEPSKMVFAEPKTDRSRRKIFLPEIALAALKGQRKRQAEVRLAAGKEWTDRGLIFTTRNGGPLEANNTIRRFHALLKDAKLPTIRFHDLRHGAASLLLSRGVHPRAVMELLGHSKIGVTMDTYSHVMAPMMRDVADQMDKALGA